MEEPVRPEAAADRYLPVRLVRQIVVPMLVLGSLVSALLAVQGQWQLAAMALGSGPAGGLAAVAAVETVRPRIRLLRAAGHTDRGPVAQTTVGA